MSTGRGTLLTQAITLVLHYPQAAAVIENREVLDKVDKSGVEVLFELLSEACAAPKANTAMLLERWRDRPEYGRLSQLAMAEPLVASAEAAKDELKMAVEKLIQEFGPGRRMDQLLRKAGELGLNSEEKAELSGLLQSRGRPRTAS
jgi:DNA primase